MVYDHNITHGMATIMAYVMDHAIAHNTHEGAHHMAS